MTTLKRVRDEVAQAIEEQGYTVRSLAYRPVEPLSSYVYRNDPIVTVVSRAVDEVMISRMSKEREVWLSVFLEAKVDITVDGQIDTLIDSTEEIMTVCSSLWGWKRNVAVRDETDMPFMFHVVRNNSLYQAIFNPVYFQVKSQGR